MAKTGRFTKWVFIWTTLSTKKKVSEILSGKDIFSHVLIFIYVNRNQDGTTKAAQTKTIIK